MTGGLWVLMKDFERFKRDMRRLSDRGHGHVFPRQDGAKARCGGPELCPQCKQDAMSTGKGMPYTPKPTKFPPPPPRPPSKPVNPFALYAGNFEDAASRLRRATSKEQAIDCLRSMRYFLEMTEEAIK